MAEEEGAHEGDFEFEVVGELGVSSLGWGECGLDEEAVGGGAREGCGELGLGLEDDLESGVRQGLDESTRWVNQELVWG